MVHVCLDDQRRSGRRLRLGNDMHIPCGPQPEKRSPPRRAFLRLRRDPAGNVHIHYRRGRASGPPLVIEAHMDHPGFMARRTGRDGILHADFLGGVRPSHFAEARARFWINEPPALGSIAPVRAAGRWVPAAVVERGAGEEGGLVESAAEPAGEDSAGERGDVGFAGRGGGGGMVRGAGV